ncbi:hypothetical protein I5I61_21530 [Pseudomonas nitroreducens]|uniref:Glycogen branching protein n=1 Tax=Pseudomonas nitroreducens TaxID=46680 RepID=A0ABS0KRR8_PSENT|nr:hypothetical protein [Pseudomonas nitroreducens]MBG6290045.1 hypothetical protein [Pseudomonas nitroreducens]
MAKITITQAFNYQLGATTKHYPVSKGAVEVPDEVAAHARARGFTEQKDAAKATQAAPAPATQAVEGTGSTKA